MSYVLILILIRDGADEWYRGFTTKAACQAQALLMHAEWFACVQVGT
jgi:hypothetical protein